MEIKKSNHQLIKPSKAECPDFAAIIRQSNTDTSLFEQIAVCYSKKLETFATSYCRDHHLGKDAFQEAMITAFTKLDTFRGDSPIEPWLRRIVVTSCSKLRRGKKNDPNINTSYDAASGDASMPDNSPNQEWNLIMAQSLKHLQEHMEELKEPNREMLIAHDMHEEPIEELASRFEMTEDAIKSRLKRSRQKIREAVLTSSASM
ncbi:MAG: RNA polymerase sigma factor [Deltaproteobacteria bacterium]|nr:RNA polymerase sigma factor [Deltaproteobacteria bacterium]